MSKERIISYSVIFLVIFGSLYLCSLINTVDYDYIDEKKPNNTINIKNSADNIPANYYQDLDLNSTYVYNVTQFGDDPAWWHYFAGFRGMWKTDPGGKIIINFTGFYNRDPRDWGDSFPNTNMPYYDIDIFNKTGPPANFMGSNISNSEASGVMALGYNGFQSGFLIPINNLTEIKVKALEQSVGASNGIVFVEETHNFLYISFEEDNENIKTYLIYDRWTGLLVWAKTFSYGFKMEIQSLNFTFNYEETYNYTINEFNGPLEWSSFDGDKGYINLSSGNYILVNFTGLYNKHALDGSCFSEPIPYINITFVTNRTMCNVSNTEAADAMIIGYNNFDSGFIIPTDNLTKLKEMAIVESLGLTNGIVSIEETILTIKLNYDQIDGNQFTSLIYDIKTGLLLWAHTESTNYVLEMTITGITPGEYTIGISNPTSDDDDEDEKITRKTELSEDSLILFTSIISVIAIITASLALYAFKIKNVRSKFILIGVIGIACFTGLLTYSYGLIPLTTTVEEKSSVEVEDITLIVDYGDGNIKKWDDISIDADDATVFEVLKEYCDVEYEDYGDNGVLVTSIDGYENGEDNWYYGVNGEKIGYSCSKYELSEGDVINWVYGDDYSPA